MLNLLKIFMQLICMMAGFVAAVEADNTLDGPAKKQAVLEEVLTEARNLGVPGFLLPFVEGIIGRLIDSLVDKANATGLFPKPAPTTAEGQDGSVALTGDVAPPPSLVSHAETTGVGV